MRQSYIRALETGFFDVPLSVEPSILAINDQAFEEHIACVNQLRSPDGSLSRKTLWLVDACAFIGRTRLKGMEIPISDPIWQKADMRVSGHIGYKLAPEFFGKRYGSLILSLALDYLFLAGARQTKFCVKCSNIPSQKPPPVVADQFALLLLMPGTPFSSSISICVNHFIFP